MATSVQGRLEADDYADTFTVWRRPGECRFELTTKGAGAARLVIDALDPAAGPEASNAAWRSLEESQPIRAGKAHIGTISVPELDLAPGTLSPYIRLRVRILRAAEATVEYELLLEGD